MPPTSTDSSSTFPLFPIPNASPPPLPPSDADKTIRMLQPPTLEDGAVESPSVSRSTMRVLHVVNGEHFSGAERVQSHLARCLPRSGVHADFACVKPGRFADMLDQLDRTGNDRVKCHRVAMRGRLDLRVVGSLSRIVVNHRYELLHAHTPRTAMIASLVSRRTDVPWVYHVHSPASRDGQGMISNRINGWIERRALANCAQLICVSQSLREHMLSEGFAENRISVVHNGVPAIRPDRNRFPVVGDCWTVGMIALMRGRKGLEVALEAIGIVRDRGLDVKLRCIGPFETNAYRRKIDQRIDELRIGDAIERVGFTANVPAELAKLDAMILPSLFGEGLPMVVLESMAAGVPVIATRVEGTPEAIRHGVEGLLAEPRDAKSLAAEIESLVTGRDDWHAMAEAAVRRHAAHFSDHAMARSTAEVYRKVLDAKP